ncbi:MAG: adenine-specific methyltransferase EcoRI family protein [Ruminococcus sp.]|nr:adenine-specific methyltransferase EcoRI family protein [Ruminococcus sp.]
MANNNKALSAANKAKKDEFYTQLSDIENELRHYREHFKGKTVFCNCDDPYESNFFKYFALNFNFFGLKKLIATSYAGSPIVYTQLSLFDETTETKKMPYKAEISEVKDLNGDGAVDLTDVELLLKSDDGQPELLKGNGDFRSEECIELLKEADIVVTNPPFSLFREYVAQLMEYDKKFIIIGNQNAITYKEIFPLLKENKIWLGYGFKGNAGFFINSHYEDYAKASQHKEGMIRVSGVMWFTNLDIEKRHEDLILYRHYTPDVYPQYDNYNAIEVSNVADIPCDYDGVMGVPITFMDKFNPEQFEILGMCENLDLYGLKTRVYTSQECKDRYFELFGKKGVYDLNAAGVVDGKKVYQRVLIRKKR